jgi:hypothetical protein
MQTCPKCTSTRLHRSRTRTRLEAIRKYFGSALLYRCHGCGWRGWGKDSRTETSPIQAVPPPLDLSILDAAISRRTDKK